MDLPTEIICRIINFLPNLNDHYNLARTCNEMNNLINDPQVALKILLKYTDLTIPLNTHSEYAKFLYYHHKNTIVCSDRNYYHFKNHR